MKFILSQIILTLTIIVPLLIAVAYFTVAERKVMASIQRRRGPNVIGFWGLLQPLADGLKLVAKEIILPSKANTFIFIFSSAWTLFLSFLGWAVIPFNAYNMYYNMDLSAFYILAISSLGIYGIIMSGWSSNSKYAFLASLRAIAQMVSYEISLGIIILPVIICSGSLRLSSIVVAQEGTWYVFPLLPLFIMFFISVLAETNRAPFDLAEAEAELVAGYNVEYSGILFAMFFLGEYSNMLLMSAFCSILFLGGWLSPLSSFISFFTEESTVWLYSNTPEIFKSFMTEGSIVVHSTQYMEIYNATVDYLVTPFLNFLIIGGEFWLALKVTFFAYLFILVRACLPRYRYDQLMDLGWKIFLPFTLGYLILSAGILVAFDGLPVPFQ